MSRPSDPCRARAFPPTPAPTALPGSLGAHSLLRVAWVTPIRTAGLLGDPHDAGLRFPGSPRGTSGRLGTDLPTSSPDLRRCGAGTWHGADAHRAETLEEPGARLLYPLGAQTRPPSSPHPRGGVTLCRRQVTCGWGLGSGERAPGDRNLSLRVPTYSGPRAPLTPTSVWDPHGGGRIRARDPCGRVRRAATPAVARPACPSPCGHPEGGAASKRPCPAAAPGEPLLMALAAPRWTGKE